MTKLLSISFVFLWATMGAINVHTGDAFHAVTSFTISAWNVSFLRDMRKNEEVLEKVSERAEV